MRVLSKIFIGLFGVLLLLLVTSHQGAAQKVFRLVFILLIICTFTYIYDLRR